MASSLSFNQANCAIFSTVWPKKSNEIPMTVVESVVLIAIPLVSQHHLHRPSMNWKSTQRIDIGDVVPLVTIGLIVASGGLSNCSSSHAYYHKRCSFLKLAASVRLLPMRFWILIRFSWSSVTSLHLCHRQLQGCRGQYQCLAYNHPLLQWWIHQICFTNLLLVS